jgi:methionyl-tRNA formyltransferase
MRPRDVLSGAFIGEGSLLVQCAETFRDAGHQVTLVVTSNRVIAAWADERHIPCFPRGTDLARLLTDSPVDFLFSVANLAIVGDDVLRLPRRMAINFHDALLPRYAGVHATSWALINRESAHGVTWHEMLAAVDRGRILKQRIFDVSPGETAVSLNARCYEAGMESFAELVDDLAANAPVPREQQLDDRTYYARDRRPEAACTIRWARPAEELAALISALEFGPTDNPLGLAKIALEGGEVILVRQASVLDSQSTADPGTIVAVEREALHVATATRDLAVHSFETVDGAAVSVRQLAERFEVHTGLRLPGLSPDDARRLTSIHRVAALHEEYWTKRLASLEPLDLPYANHPAGASV